MQNFDEIVCFSCIDPEMLMILIILSLECHVALPC
jgi:hypothetical protein